MEHALPRVVSLAATPAVLQAAAHVVALAAVAGLVVEQAAALGLFNALVLCAQTMAVFRPVLLLTHGSGDVLTAVQGPMASTRVSKNDGFCIKNEEFCIKDKELCTKSKEFCI